MADINYQIIFRVQCKACGQTLDPTISDEGVAYDHGNPDDCDQPMVELPLITPEQLSALFKAKSLSTQQRAIQAEEIKKATGKKKVLGKTI